MVSTAASNSSGYSRPSKASGRRGVPAIDDGAISPIDNQLRRHLKIWVWTMGVTPETWGYKRSGLEESLIECTFGLTVQGEQ